MFQDILELRHYKNDSIESKCMLALKLLRFFPHRIGDWKSVPISKQTSSRSNIVLALELSWFFSFPGIYKWKNVFSFTWKWTLSFSINTYWHTLLQRLIYYLSIHVCMKHLSTLFGRLATGSEKFCFGKIFRGKNASYMSAKFKTFSSCWNFWYIF